MKSIILYNIPKDATVADCKRIAAHLKLEWCDGNFAPGKDFAPEGRLYVTTKKITTEQQCGPVSYISFLTAAIEVNNNIKRTPWSIKNPPCVGEWNASTNKWPTSKRWWNGRHWSIAYDDSDSEETKNRARITRAVWNYDRIQWRGPSEQSITAGFCK